MQVSITVRHGTIQPDQHQYMTQKAEKLLTYFDRVTAITVTVAFESGKAKTEILVDAEHKHNFVAQETADLVIPSFDLALHKMEQQIRKYKEKIQDHRRDQPMNELAGGNPE